MEYSFIGQPVRRILLIGILAVLVAMLIIPRAASQETRTLDLEIVFTQESFEVAPAFGNEPSDEAFVYRGDILSGQAAVYPAGETDGERIGTFYFMAATTAEPQHAETAANHLYAQGYFELFGEGEMAVTGLVNFMNPYSVAITGGTGSYTGAGGQCLAIPGEENETWSCQVR